MKLYKILNYYVDGLKKEKREDERRPRVGVYWLYLSWITHFVGILQLIKPIIKRVVKRAKYEKLLSMPRVYVFQELKW